MLVALLKVNVYQIGLGHPLTSGSPHMDYSILSQEGMTLNTASFHYGVTAQETSLLFHWRSVESYWKDRKEKNGMKYDRLSLNNTSDNVHKFNAEYLFSSALDYSSIDRHMQSHPHVSFMTNRSILCAVLAFQHHSFAVGNQLSISDEFDYYLQHMPNFCYESSLDASSGVFPSDLYAEQVIIMNSLGNVIFLLGFNASLCIIEDFYLTSALF